MVVFHKENLEGSDGRISRDDGSTGRLERLCLGGSRETEDLLDRIGRGGSVINVWCLTLGVWWLMVGGDVPVGGTYSYDVSAVGTSPEGVLICLRESERGREGEDC
jgi:hypothetical protein